MLRSVFGVFLDSLKRETELHQLIAVLLRACAFDSVSITHGVREHGRDVIGHATVDNQASQYCIQIKLGKIEKSTVDALISQIAQAAYAHYPHPHFDKSLPLIIVVCTNATISTEAAALISATEPNLPCRIETWDRQKLLDMFEAADPSIMHLERLSDAVRIPQFLTLVGKCASAEASLFEIEEYTRRWTDYSAPFSSSLEAAVLRTAFFDNDSCYEALYVDLCLLRALVSGGEESCFSTDRETRCEILELLEGDACLITSEIESFLSNSKTLVSILQFSAWITGPIVCQRWLEVLFFYSILDVRQFDRVAELTHQLLNRCPQCFHPVSDKSAVSLFGAGLLLMRSGNRFFWEDFIKRTASCLFDCYDSGRPGLASVDDDVVDEVRYFLGYSFEGVPVVRRSSSFVLTALIDLTLIAGHRSLYADLLNDALATNMLADAYVITSQAAVWEIESDQVIYNPNIQPPEWEVGDARPHMPHWQHLTPSLPDWMVYATSMLLRDRLHPQHWAH